MYLIRRGVASWIIGAGITGLLFHMNFQAPHGVVAFVLLSAVIAYLLWTASLLATWTYWDLHENSQRAVAASSQQAPIDLAARQQHHLFKGTHRAS
jgi:hypothetical protein